MAPTTPGRTTPGWASSSRCRQAHHHQDEGNVGVGDGLEHAVAQAPEISRTGALDLETCGLPPTCPSAVDLLAADLPDRRPDVDHLELHGFGGRDGDVCGTAFSIQSGLRQRSSARARLEGDKTVLVIFRFPKGLVDLAADSDGAWVGRADRVPVTGGDVRGPGDEDPRKGAGPGPLGEDKDDHRHPGVGDGLGLISRHGAIVAPGGCRISTTRAPACCFSASSSRLPGRFPPGRGPRDRLRRSSKRGRAVAGKTVGR